MSPEARKPRSPAELRQLAEASLTRRPSRDLDALAPDEIRHLVHELEIHRVELEIQNQELQEARLANQASEERYRRLYEGAPVGFLTLDPEGVILMANRFASELLKLPRDRLLGRTLSSLVADRSQDRWYLARRALFESGTRDSFDLEFRLDDGRTLEIQIVGAGPTTGGVTLNLALLDVTGLRDAERSLREAANEASLAEQRERRKLASDLHDDAGQLLSLASMKLRALSEATPSEHEEGIRDLTKIVQEVRQRISSLSFQLSPPLLHDVGLVSATQWLAEDLERRYDLSVTVLDGPEPAVDEATGVTLFRSIRELLINVAKHSGSDSARVRIWTGDGRVHVVVEDDGRGFPREGAREGFGLVALRERIRQLGGTVTLGSGAGGQGSRATVSVPRPSDPRPSEGGRS
jgi:PAS domain S-box-containing protein